MTVWCPLCRHGNRQPDAESLLVHFQEKHLQDDSEPLRPVPGETVDDPGGRDRESRVNDTKNWVIRELLRGILDCRRVRMLPGVFDFNMDAFSQGVVDSLKPDSKTFDLLRYTSIVMVMDPSGVQGREVDAAAEKATERQKQEAATRLEYLKEHLANKNYRRAKKARRSLLERCPLTASAQEARRMRIPD